jgi:hypothetical protein
VRVELDIPVPNDQVMWVIAARDTGVPIDFRNKHGKIERCRVIKVEYLFTPQGVGKGYFMDLMFDGSDVNVSEYLAQKLADKQAGQ